MYIKILKAGSIIIMFFLIFYLGSLISWVFQPLVVFFQTLFIPMLIAGVLYYLFRPLIQLFSKKMPRMLAIVLLFVALIGVMITVISIFGPKLEKQLHNLIGNLPTIFSRLQLLIIDIQQSELVQRLGLEEMFDWDEKFEQVSVVVGNLVGDIVSSGFTFLGTIFNSLILVLIVPFILFYLLKEGEKFPNLFLRFINEEKQREVRSILTNMDQTLSNYIQSVLIVCSFIGVFYYIGFTIIRLDYALILAIVGMITNIIPYVGPWLGGIPAVIVALLHSPMMALFVLIIVVVIQQIESIFVQPQIVGRKMSIHPVTVMALVLVAGRFIGVVGMILVIPTYAVVKVIATHLYRLWKLKGEKP